MATDDLAVVLAGALADPIPDDGEVTDLEIPDQGPSSARPAHRCTAPETSGLSVMNLGGSIVTLESRSFDASELLDSIEREGINLISMVGDAFGKPILKALDTNPGRWNLSSLLGITSSGVMWSEEVKQQLLEHQPNMVLIDAFSSSEALGMGMSTSGGGSTRRLHVSNWASIAW